MTTTLITSGHSSRATAPRRRQVWFLTLVAATAAGFPGTTLAQQPESTLPMALARIYAAGTPASLDDLRMMDAHQRELVKRITQPTVAIRIGSTFGSGVIVSKDGYVLTAAHVAGRPDLTVRVYTADGQSYYGKTLGMNKGMDAGLIKIDSVQRDGKQVEWPSAEIGDAAEVLPGGWCLALGHPGGFQEGRQPVVRFGRVIANSSKVIETDCKLVGGDSGGPLFDMEGKVIGIHSRIGTKLTKNLHVPADAYRHDWEKLARGDSWGSLLDVIEGSVIEQPIIGVLGERDSDEPRIASVLPASPAERAGLKPGDLVIRFGGEEVKKFPTLKQLVSRRRPGDEVIIEVMRGGETLDFSIVIGSYRDE